MQAILKQRLEILARQIGPEWETLASKLNVGVLRSARRCPTNSTYDLVLDTLTRWQKRSKPLNHLVNALRASGRPELARVVERWQKPDRQRRGCFRSRAKRYCNVLRFAEDDDDDDDENQERADENFACDEGEAEDHNDDDDDDNGDNEFETPDDIDEVAPLSSTPSCCELHPPIETCDFSDGFWRFRASNFRNNL